MWLPSCEQKKAQLFEGWVNTTHGIAVLSPINNKPGWWSNYSQLIRQTKDQLFKAGQYNSRQQGGGWENSVSYWNVRILLVDYYPFFDSHQKILNCFLQHRLMTAIDGDLNWSMQHITFNSKKMDCWSWHIELEFSIHSWWRISAIPRE